MWSVISVSAALAVGLPLAAQARTIVVPSGSILTIQDGVAAADPGDTIKVLPGTYEGVVVATPRVKLKAESTAGSVKVEPSGGAMGFLIVADDVEIVGFEVAMIGLGPTAIGVAGNRVHVANNSVRGGNRGIEVGSVSGTRIDHNKVHAEIAIALSGASGTDIKNNEVIGSEGIRVSSCSDTRVDDNDVSAGSGYAIDVVDSPGTRLSHNIILCNHGINIASTECQIEHNIIDASVHGIFVYGDSCGNVFTHNSAHGAPPLDPDLLSQEDPAAPCNIYRHNDADGAFPSLEFWDVKGVKP